MSKAEFQKWDNEVKTCIARLNEWGRSFHTLAVELMRQNPNVQIVGTESGVPIETAASAPAFRKEGLPSLSRINQEMEKLVIARRRRAAAYSTLSEREQRLFDPAGD